MFDTAKAFGVDFTTGKIGNRAQAIDPVYMQRQPGDSLLGLDSIV